MFAMLFLCCYLLYLSPRDLLFSILCLRIENQEPAGLTSIGVADQIIHNGFVKQKLLVNRNNMSNERTVVHHRRQSII